MQPPSPSLFVTLTEDGTPSIGINFSKTETLPAVEDIFEGFHSFVKAKNKRGVVVFDEFQQVGELEDTRIERTVQRGIKSLLNKGIIDKEGENVEIDDIFLKFWLNKRMSYSVRQNFE